MVPSEENLSELAISCLHRDNFGRLRELSQLALLSSARGHPFYRLALVFGRCHVDLTLKEAVQESQAIWDLSLKAKPIDKYEVLDVYTACMYHMIQEFGRKLLEGDEWQTQESPAKLPLRRIRQQLIGQGRLDELMFVFRAEKSLYSPQEIVCNLMETLEVVTKEYGPGDPELHNFKAAIHIALARAFGTQDCVEKCMEQVKLATQSCTVTGNHRQYLWIQFFSVLYGEDIERSKKIEALETIALQFLQVEDFRGFLSCKMEIAQRYQKEQQSIKYHSTVASAFRVTTGIDLLAVSGEHSSATDPHSCQIGSALAFWQSYMGMMPHDMVHFPFIGTALKLGTKFFEIHPKCSIPELKFALSSDLSTLYGEKLGDTSNEFKWAAIAVTHAKETNDQEIIVEAEKRFRVVLSGANVVPGDDRHGFHLVGWREAQKTDLEIEFEVAGQEGRWEDQFTFANQLFTLQLLEQLKGGAPITGEPWSSQTKLVLECLPDTDLRKSRYTAIDLSIAGTIFESGDAERAAGLLEEIIKTMVSTHSLLRQKVYFLLGRARLQMYRDTSKHSYLEESRRLVEVVLQETLLEGMPDMAACCHCILADSWMNTDSIDKESASRALHHIQEAEALWSAERDGIWNLEGLDGLLARFSLRARNEGGPIDVFAIAYRACFAIGDHATAWKWAQKAKARGFNHALEAHKEKDASTDRLPLVRSTTTMVANQSEGNVVDCGWLAMKGENVVFIDWITAGDTIYMLSSRPGETVLMHLLEIGLSTVEQWYTDLAKSKDDLSDAEEARETLLELAALCKPLQNLEVARPGDLLVLCPTKVLSKIPLHALEVDGDVLLARNPIVYTYALPVLMQCLDMFDQRREQAKDLKPSLFGNPTANTPFNGATPRRRAF